MHGCMHVTDQIEAYVAGGLTAAERGELEAHVASCAACAAALKEITDMDATMNQLFADARPAGGFEDRLIQRLRQLPRRRRFVHPMVRRVATGVAAAIMLAGVGYIGNGALNGRGISLPGWGGSRDSFSASAHSAAIPGYALYSAADRHMYLRGHVKSVDEAEKLNDQNSTVAQRDASITDLRRQVTPMGRDKDSFSDSDRKKEADLKRNEIADVRGRAIKSADESISSNSTFSYRAEKLQASVSGTNSLATSTGRGDSAGSHDIGFIGSSAVPEQQLDSVLLPTDDRDGDSPKLLQDLEATKKKAETSYFSLALTPPAAEPGQVNRGMEFGRRQLNEQESRNTNGRIAGAKAPEAGGKPAVTIPKLDIIGAVDVAKAGTKADERTGVQLLADAAQQQAPPAEEGKPSQPATQTPPPAPAPVDANTRPDPAGGRKIIRNGEMEFEVDSFDSAVMQIGKIVAEEGGFLSTTESDKLPNGKVKGRVVLRCPPDRLDTLVLKLRGIGDLRTQKIGAQDVTKQYTDTESALRAAHAMQERLLDIIKNGKGTVKDLLEAEKQLGVWREKIEQLEGEIRYYNNLISLSTLSVTLYERDIKNPAFASETETIAMSLETEKVEDDYQKARDAIAEAKGRITGSELKQFDAGQYRATISALLPPDAAEAVIARIRQLDGRLAHFERQRSQNTSNGKNVARNDAVRLKREDVELNLTIYNLANIAPRRTTTLLIVAPNVEEAYRNLIEQVNSSGGRIVTSTIARPRPDQSAGNVNFNVPVDKADVILTVLRGYGEVVKTDTSESPDTQNVTESKRGFSVTISSLSAFAARESQQVQLASPEVTAAFNDVLNAVRGKDGRVIHSQLNEQDPQNVTGTIDFEMPRADLSVIDQAMHLSAEVVSRVVTRSTDTENTVDNKVHFSLAVTSADRLPARESLVTQLAAANVVDAFTTIRAGVPKGGRILASELNEQDPQNVSAHLVFDVPQAAEPALTALLKKNTAVMSRQVRRVPEGQVAVEKLRVELTLVSADRQPPRQTFTEGVLVSDVQKASDDLVNAAVSVGGRQSDNPSVSQDPGGHTSATITVDVPADKAQSILDQIDHMGARRTRQVSLNTSVPESNLARAQIQVTFSDSAATLGGQESMADYVRNGVMTSLKGLGYSLMWIIVGICLVAPWVLLIWGGWKLIRRSRRTPVVAPAAPKPA